MLKLNQVSKKYKTNKEETLKNISIEMNKNDVVVIVGGSGSGKTTLLNIIGSLDRDFTGSYTIDGIDIQTLSVQEIAKLRNHYFGYIFQDYMLIEDESVYYNIHIPLLYSKKFSKKEHKKMIYDICETLEITALIHKKVATLSGGEKQRVAIARALIHEPEVIIMDEGTNALDEDLTEKVMQYLYAYVQTKNKSLIIVTHEIERVSIKQYRLLRVGKQTIEDLGLIVKK